MQDTRVLPAKRHDGNCTRRYSRGFRNQNEEHLCKLNNLDEIPTRLVSPVLKVQIT